MSCEHVDSFELRPPNTNQAVYREECTQCFDSVVSLRGRDDPNGLDVCLHCFNGGCTGDRRHAALHFDNLKHPLVLNLRRSRRVTQRDEPPPKISKISIAAETEADRYEYQTTVKCLACNVEGIGKSAGRLAEVVNGVMKANNYSTQEEVKAWEQVYTSCEHILTLNQEPSKQIPSQNLGHCSLCELQENLWLCLQCGNLGCGRAQFGGLKGNSHGLEHKNNSGHAVAVKLGSITAEGNADVYCYACDEERLDHELGRHLEHWGIILTETQKTEKSLTEMQLDENLRWDFSTTDEDGQELRKIFGGGFTGLKNLGNSCYLASTIQCLFALPQFRDRYCLSEDLPYVDFPAQDLETQLRKLGDGLISGRYSYPDPNSFGQEGSANLAYQRGISPAMLKYLVGKGHPEFSTMLQQDAFEFTQHLFKLITRSNRGAPHRDPIRAFRFVIEQRLQCLSCKKVRYRSDEQDNISIPVPLRKLTKLPDAQDINNNQANEYEPVTLKQCLDSFTSQEIVELTCSSCGSRDGFFKRSLFETFPEVLVVNARRFLIVNWVPQKVNVPVVIGDDPFSMDEYKSSGHQPHEELLPEEKEKPRAAFIPNEEALRQLESMGFSTNHCKKALYSTGNSDANVAMDWLFSHMEDPEIDSPVEFISGTSNNYEADPGKIEMLAAMGFSNPLARKALTETGGDLERAVEWLFSHPDDLGESLVDSDMAATSGPVGREECPGSNDLPVNFQLHSIICHKGASIHSGHYVAFIRHKIPEDDSVAWILYNDEKVVQALDVTEMKNFAYVYFFQRTGEPVPRKDSDKLYHEFREKLDR